MRASRASALLAMLLVAAAARAADLGTLFYTPAEREGMDRLRRGEPSETAAAASPPARAITGYVKRSDGRSTVWIDGRPVVVADPKAERLLEPHAVNAYSRGGVVKVEPGR